MTRHCLPKPENPFERAEYAEQLERVRAEMERAGVDVLFVSAPEGFYYVSWGRVADALNQERIGLVLEEFLRRSDFIPSCIGAAVAFTVALLILGLPPRRSTIPTAAQQVPVKQEA